MTRVGSNYLLMAYVHIGHDSQVGSHCILANAATLAGHVMIEDYASVGAFCPVHQFCTVGQYAFIGGGTIVTQDVLPFSLTSSRRENKAFGINKVGLTRRGFSPERLRHAAEGLPAAAGVADEHLAGSRKDSRAGRRRCGDRSPALSSAASAGLSSNHEARPDRRQRALSISAAGCGAGAGICGDGGGHPRRDRSGDQPSRRGGRKDHRALALAGRAVAAYRHLPQRRRDAWR